VDAAPDLDRLGVMLVLTNGGHDARTVDGVQVTGVRQVTGLGQVASAHAGPAVRLAPGADLRLPLVITPDCATLYRGGITVRVDGHTLTPTGADPRTLLAPLCPAPVSGPAVDVVAARADPAGGPVVVRIVNHGTDAVTLTSSPSPDPALLDARLTVLPAPPTSLVPGQAATLRLSVTPPRCPAPDASPNGRTQGAAPAPVRTDALTLRAGTDRGEVPVGGWPSALLSAEAGPAGVGCHA
jgi:hypothetical protein